MALANINQLYQQQQLLPCYLISSEEPLLLIEAKDFLRDLAQKSGFTERTSYQTDKGFEWSMLASQGQSLSLFAEKKIIELTLTKKAGRDGSKAIRDFVESGCDDVCLIIYTGKLDRAQQNAAWVKAINAHGLACIAWPIKAQQMPQWIRQRADKLQLTMHPDAIQLLSNYTEGNLLAAQQALLKLSSKHDSNTTEISVQTVRDDLANQAKFNLYELFSTASTQPERALRMLHTLQFEGVEPYPILWSLSQEITQALQIKLLTNAGDNFSAACKQAGVWQSKQNAIQTVVNAFSVTFLTKLVKRCQMIDLSVKGLHKDDVWRQLNELILLLGKPAMRRRGIA